MSTSDPGSIEVPARGRFIALGESHSRPSFGGWRSAKRGVLEVDPLGLTFSSWSISRDRVSGAIWFTPSELPLPLTAVLRVLTPEGTFEFSIEPRLLSPAKLPFAVDREAVPFIARRYKVLIAALLVAFVLFSAFARG